MSLTTKPVAFGAILLALVAGAWKVYHAIDKAGYVRAQASAQPNYGVNPSVAALGGPRKKSSSNGLPRPLYLPSYERPR